jgi:hypothetical protein
MRECVVGWYTDHLQGKTLGELGELEELEEMRAAHRSEQADRRC